MIRGLWALVALAVFGQEQYVAFYSGAGNSSTALHVYRAGLLQPFAQLSNVSAGTFQVVPVPDGSKYYVIANGGTAVQAVDGAFANLRTVASSFSTGAPVFAAMQPDGRRLMVLAGRVYWIDAATDAVLNPDGLVVDGTPIDVAVSFDSSKAFVLSRSSPGPAGTVLTVIDLANNFARLGVLTFNGNQLETATGLTMGPSGNLYLSGYARVFEISTDTLQLTPGGELPVRAHLGRGTLTPDGKYIVFPNRQPVFGGNSVVQLDLSTRTFSYDAASTSEIFTRFTPATPAGDSPTKLYGHGATGRLYDITLGSQVILDRSQVVSRFQSGLDDVIFPNLSFSNEAPPRTLWYTRQVTNLDGSTSKRIVQAGLSSVDQSIQEQNLPFTQNLEMAFLTPSVTSGGTRILAYNQAQTVPAATRTGLPLVARIVDALGRPIYRGQIAFSSPDPAVIIQSPQSVTGIDGWAQTFVTAPNAPGVYRVTAESGPGVAPIEYTIAVQSGITLGVAGGDQQTVRGNSFLPIPLQVRVTDQDGHPVSGYLVGWSVVAPGTGALGESQTLSGSNGIAQNTFLTGPIVGPLQVKAEVSNPAIGGPPISVLFTVHVLAPIGSLSLLAGSFQSTGIGTEFRDPIVVQVNDVNGGPLSGVRVDFTSTGQVTVLESSVVTAADGRAATHIRAGASTGIYYVQATAGQFSAQVSLTVLASNGMQFVSVAPCRVSDTRNPSGVLGGPFLPAQATREIPVPQSTCGIPSNALAYSFNATVVPRGPLGYITLWPTGRAQPASSTLNSTDGRIKANAAIVQAGASGSVSVFATEATEVILDINGYFLPPRHDGLVFYPLTPCRVLDTRVTSSPLAAGESRAYSLFGNCQIPATAKALALNATEVPRSVPFGYLTLWPDGVSRPEVSTLNAVTGAIAANAAVVPLSAGGGVRVFVSDPADVILDVNGYFASAGGGGALQFYPVAPCRVADTRNANGPLGGPALVAGVTRTLPVAQSVCGIPATAKAYVLNTTVIPSGVFGYLSLWPTGGNQPIVSTLNAVDGFITSNMAIVPAGTNGSIDVFGSNAAHVLFDITGYFAP